MEQLVEKKHGVYNIYPCNNTNCAIIKCIEVTNDLKGILDTPLAHCLGTTDVKSFIYELDPNVYVRFYRCSIFDSYLMMNRTMPVIYAAIMYNDKLMAGSLLNISVKFDIHSEITEENKLINSVLTGNYKIVIEEVLDKNERKVDKYYKIIELGEFTSEEEMIDFLKEIAQDLKEIANKIILDRRKETQKKHGIDYTSYKITRPQRKFDDIVEEYIQKNMRSKHK